MKNILLIITSTLLASCNTNSDPVLAYLANFTNLLSTLLIISIIFIIFNNLKKYNNV